MIWTEYNALAKESQVSAMLVLVSTPNRVSQYLLKNLSYVTIPCAVASLRPCVEFFRWAQLRKTRPLAIIASDIVRLFCFG